MLTYVSACMFHISQRSQKQHVVLQPKFLTKLMHNLPSPKRTIPPPLCEKNTFGEPHRRHNSKLSPKALSRDLLLLLTVACFPGLVGCWVLPAMTWMLSGAGERTTATTISWAQASRTRYLCLHAWFRVYDVLARGHSPVCGQSVFIQHHLLSDTGRGDRLLSRGMSAV